MSQFISVFDMLKIGVGPSSSHTLGPWRAAEQWILELKENEKFHLIDGIQVDLYGSLSLTGKGHATDLAIQLGLSGADPEYVPIKDIDGIINDIKEKEQLFFNNEKNVPFYKKSIVFNREFLPFHSNGITFRGFLNGEEISTQTYFSIGGGFIVQENNHLDAELSLAAGQSNIEDLDFAKAVANFEQSKVALQAAQQSFVQVKDLSLFNYI